MATSRPRKRHIFRPDRFLRVILFLPLVILALSASSFRLTAGCPLGVEQVQSHITVTVTAGDTLWDLAQKYGPRDQDLRLTVHEIMEENRLRGAAIYPGQRLVVPVR